MRVEERKWSRAGEEGPYKTSHGMLVSRSVTSSVCATQMSIFYLADQEPAAPNSTSLMSHLPTSHNSILAPQLPTVCPHYSSRFHPLFFFLGMPRLHITPRPENDSLVRQ